MAKVRIPRTLVGIVREVSRLLRDPPLAIWTLFVFLIPFYVFLSGLPQPGDMLLVPLFCVTMWTWRGRLNPRARRPFLSLIIFTLWVIAVDWGWAVLLGNFGVFGPDTFLLFPVYYVFNACVFLVVCVLYQRFGARFLWLTLHIVLISVVTQALATLFVHRSGLRGTGFFNNPNQLGFFALVMASVLALGKRNLGFGSLKSGIGFTTCFYLALISASRSAVIGCALLFAFSVLSNPRRILAVGLLGLALGAIGGPIFEAAVDTTQQRLTTDHYAQLNFFEERGYDRILNHKEYWALGAGEGGTSRFVQTTKIGATEIHSSIGTLFFSYGVMGVLLFAIFLFRVVRGARFKQWILLLPALSYTIAHQGLRSTSMWILFAVFVCFKQMAVEQRKAARAAKAASRAPTPTSLPIAEPLPIL